MKIKILKWIAFVGCFVLCSSNLSAAVIILGTKIGVDLGSGPTTLNWNNFNANGTAAAGSVIGLGGATIDGVAITVSEGEFFNGGGTDNWAGLSTNGGSAPPEFLDSVVTDIGGNLSTNTNPFTLSITGLSTAFNYNVTAVTTASNSGQTETVTLIGNSSMQSVISRADSESGMFHSFVNFAPTAGGVLTIEVSELALDNNPILNGLLLEATTIPEPSRALLSLVGIAMIGLRRRRS